MTNLIFGERSGSMQTHPLWTQFQRLRPKRGSLKSQEPQIKSGQGTRKACCQSHWDCTVCVLVKGYTHLPKISSLHELCLAAPTSTRYVALNELLLLLLFFFFKGHTEAYGGSQARGQIGVVAASLHHSHCNLGSKQSL